MTTTMTVANNKDIEAEARTYRATMAGGKNLSDEQAINLFRIGRAQGLNPWNGEIWHIPGSGVSTGIKGLRKQAHKQIPNGNFWTTFRNITDTEERKSLQIPDNAVAFEARLFDSETMATYVNSVKSLRDAGLPIDIVLEMLGKQPYSSGIGIFTIGEPTKMKPAECAMKRAEAPAIRRRFDVSLLVDVDNEPDGNGAPYIDGSVVDTSTGEIVEGHTAETAPAFGAHKTDPRPWPAATVREKVIGFAATLNQPSVATNGDLKSAMASLSGLVNGRDSDRKAVLRYLFGVDSGAQLTVSQCKALKRWIGSKPNADGEWVPEPHAASEADGVIAADAVARGQLVLPITGDPVLDTFAGQPAAGQ